jgi:hypothetical protein
VSVVGGLFGSRNLLRMARDDSQRAWMRLTAVMSRGTANANGVIGTAHGHFTHAVKTWRSDFTEIGAVNDFLNNDQVQYWSPCDVQAGTSGDFFGYDSNRNRIVIVVSTRMQKISGWHSHLGG